MASCVLSTVVDTDNNDATVVACMVHTHYAPCPFNGQPASPIALHSDDVRDGGRLAAVAFWRIRTNGQRPLVLHHGSLTDGTHELAPDCACGPELLGARS